MDPYARVVEDVARRDAVRTAEAAVCEAWERMLLESRVSSQRLAAGRRALIGLIEERIRRATMAGDVGVIASAEAQLVRANAAAARDEMVAGEIREIVEEELGILGEAAWARADAAEADAARLAEADAARGQRPQGSDG